ncbi:ANTH-domain-containing protein [Rhizopus microsporus]|uniref:ANTH-domain-containing protein n=1 Tax=Rhizopus microsporus TaxID=58291 RepID=A0A1X0RVD3_RHIZD|nr:ANTH-domain-containing protein [Rhizopus microsporus]
METAVRKATRLDYNPPKQKHLSTLVSLTYENPGNAVYIVDLLERRLRENSWIIIFKVLIILHTLMRNGDGDKTIAYIETKPSALDTTKLREKSSGVVHIQNIYLYTAYLQQKVIAYRQSKVDYIKDTMGKKEGRLRHLSISDGLLKETVSIQKLIGTLLKCNFLLDDVDNNISLYAFRLLVEDLLVLFQVLNEAIVNILEHYFAMKKSDARTSLEIYKRFARQTEETISFLDRARRLQHELSISIPSVKHAPLSLAAALQEYLDDQNHGAQQPQPQQQQQQVVTSTNNVQQPKELIDFFTSLENEKVNIFYNQIVPVAPQPQAIQSMVLPQSTGHNPFRQSTLPAPSATNYANPFRASTMPLVHNSSMPLQQPNATANQLIIPQATSTHNPFAANSMVPVASPTNLSNNPFGNNNQQQWGQ